MTIKTELNAKAEHVLQYAHSLKEDSVLVLRDYTEDEEKAIRAYAADLWAYRLKKALSKELATNAEVLEDYIDDASWLFLFIHAPLINALGFDDTVRRTDTIKWCYDAFMTELGIDAKYRELLIERPLVKQAGIYVYRDFGK